MHLNRTFFHNNASSELVLQGQCCDVTETSGNASPGFDNAGFVDSVTTLQGTDNSFPSRSGIDSHRTRSVFGCDVAAFPYLLGHDNTDAKTDAHVRSVKSLPFPQHGNMHVAHIDREMCVALINSTRVYDGVRILSLLEIADTRRVRSGDVVGKLVVQGVSDPESDLIVPEPFTISALSCVSFGERVMVLVPSDAAVDSRGMRTELAFGGLRLRAVAGFTHFGLSVPSEFFCKIVFHLRSEHIVPLFQTGAINKSFGAFENRFFPPPSRPSIRFNHALGESVDFEVTPQGVALYDVPWVGATQSILCLNGAQFFHVGHVTVLVDAPLSFVVLAPTPTAYGSTVVALLARTDISPYCGQQLVDLVARARIEDDDPAFLDSNRFGLASMNNFGCSRSDLDLRVITHGDDVVSYYVKPKYKFDIRDALYMRSRSNIGK